MLVQIRKTLTLTGTLSTELVVCLPFFVVLIIPIQIIVFILYPPPTTTLEWFNLFQENRIIGLLDMDLLFIIDQLLFGFVILALYIKLRHINTYCSHTWVYGYNNIFFIFCRL